MYDQNTVIALALACLLAGVLLGYFVIGRLKPGGQSRAVLERQLVDMQRQQRDYQLQVNEHFDRTAQLLNDMAESYRNVHNHIVEGTKTLHASGISPLQPIPEGRPVLDNKPTASSLTQQPLDYAPRNPGDKGSLHEEFGLEKEAKEKVPEPPAAPHA